MSDLNASAASLAKGDGVMLVGKGRGMQGCVRMRYFAGEGEVGRTVGDVLGPPSTINTQQPSYRSNI